MAYITNEQFIEGLIVSYLNKDAASLHGNASMLSVLFDDMDTLLNSHRRFMLGDWLKKARANGVNTQVSSTPTQ